MTHPPPQEDQMSPQDLSTDDLFNELHRRLCHEAEAYYDDQRPTRTMMAAVRDQIDEAHHVYTDLTTDPVEAQS